MEGNAFMYETAAEWDETILYKPPPAGTCPFEKAMSPEIILGIVEFLEAPQCLTLSQVTSRHRLGICLTHDNSIDVQTNIHSLAGTTRILG